MNNKIKKLVLTGVFAALITTGILIIKIPTVNGYIHVGDSMIYIAALVLPFPYGIVAAGIGGGLADFFTGYTVYILPTMIIKSLNACVFYLIKSNYNKLFTKKTILVTLASGCVTIIGYYIVAVILYGNPTAQLVLTIPENTIQAVGSTIVFSTLAIGLDKARFKSMVNVV